MAVAVCQLIQIEAGGVADCGSDVEVPGVGCPS
jgi:hypothetical protein